MQNEVFVLCNTDYSFNTYAKFPEKTKKWG